MKENIRREYLRRTKLIMKNRLNGKNKIMPINTLAVSLTALFLCKTLRKGIENGGGVKRLGALFPKKSPFFIKKCPFWPISNAALNF